MSQFAARWAKYKQLPSAFDPNAFKVRRNKTQSLRRNREAAERAMVKRTMGLSASAAVAASASASVADDTMGVEESPPRPLYVLTDPDATGAGIRVETLAAELETVLAAQPLRLGPDSAIADLLGRWYEMSEDPAYAPALAGAVLGPLLDVVPGLAADQVLTLCAAGIVRNLCKYIMHDCMGGRALCLVPGIMALASNLLDTAPSEAASMIGLDIMAALLKLRCRDVTDLMCRVTPGLVPLLFRFGDLMASPRAPISDLGALALKCLCRVLVCVRNPAVEDSIVDFLVVAAKSLAPVDDQAAAAAKILAKLAQYFTTCGRSEAEVQTRMEALGLHTWLVDFMIKPSVHVDVMIGCLELVAALMNHGRRIAAVITSGGFPRMTAYMLPHVREKAAVRDSLVWLVSIMCQRCSAMLTDHLYLYTYLGDLLMDKTLRLDPHTILRAFYGMLTAVANVEGPEAADQRELFWKFNLEAVLKHILATEMYDMLDGGQLTLSALYALADIMFNLPETHMDMKKDTFRRIAIAPRGTVSNAARGVARSICKLFFSVEVADADILP